MEQIDIKHLIKEAKHNQDAMIILGHCYKNGYGIKQDCYKATKCFSRASMQGNQIAKEQVAELYMNFYEYYTFAEKEMKELVQKYNNPNGYCLLAELYTKHNKLTEAKECLEKAIQLNAPSVNYLLGKLNTETNPQKAFNCFKDASDLGDDRAVCELGICYANGIGTNKDISKALEFLTVAAHKVASTMRARLYLAMSILQNEVEDRYGEAIDLLNSVSYKIDKKNAESLDWIYCNAICNLEGKGMPANLKQGFKLLNHYELENHKLATLKKIECYQKGLGCKVNPPEAEKLKAKLEEVEIVKPTKDDSPYNQTSNKTDTEEDKFEKEHTFARCPVCGSHKLKITNLECKGQTRHHYTVRYRFSSSDTILDPIDENGKTYTTDYLCEHCQFKFQKIKHIKLREEDAVSVGNILKSFVGAEDDSKDEYTIVTIKYKALTDSSKEALKLLKKFEGKFEFKSYTYK